MSKNKIPKKRNSDSLTFEYLKKEKNSEIFNSNLNNNEESLIKLRSYINYPMLISDSFSIKQISSGNNHNIILLSDGNVIFFGNNQFNQCFSEKKEIVLLPSKEDIKKCSLSNEFYNSRGEYIQNIKAKDNS